MRIADALACEAERGPFWSFEYFPPKTVQGMSTLLDRIERMTALSPLFINVTWGAGGTTRERSLDMAGTIQQTYGIDVCLHLTCTNMSKQMLDETLAEAKAKGIHNILALRGDPPRGEEYWVATDENLQNATDLVKYIKRSYGDHFCIGVASYPEGHIDSDGENVDIDYLKQKEAAGADFAITQLFYDTDLWLSWLGQCRSAGVTIPIIPAIMPIQTYQSFRRMTNLCKTRIPTAIRTRLEPVKTDDAAVRDIGVDVACQMIEQLHAAGIRGFHICTLNLETSTRRVLQSAACLNLSISEESSLHSKKLEAQSKALYNTNIQGKKSSERWDEFPNGRFGDVRSPAYGDIDGWGISLKTSPSNAIRYWGSPVDLSDISAIFMKFLTGQVPAIPWCEEEIATETKVIIPQLSRIISERSWWTVGSQPAVNAAPSEDPVYGFGPVGGFVFQKAFVEFFCEEKDVLAIAERAANDPYTTFFAGDRHSSFLTNATQETINVVTWAAFPGKEIIQPTIIEETSFKAWKDEAFAIWSEWELLFAPLSASRNLLREVGNKRWLCSVVHHDFKNPHGLWTFLSNV